MKSAAEMEALVKERAKQFTEENINDPTPEHYILIHNAMIIGFEIGVRETKAFLLGEGNVAAPVE